MKPSLYCRGTLRNDFAGFVQRHQLQERANAVPILSFHDGVIQAGPQARFGYMQKTKRLSAMNMRQSVPFCDQRMIIRNPWQGQAYQRLIQASWTNVYPSYPLPWLENG